MAFRKIHHVSDMLVKVQKSSLPLIPEYKCDAQRLRKKTRRELKFPL